ncbi:MAG: DUF2442 domain-containing protein [Asticcacaulis sp.]
MYYDISEVKPQKDFSLDVRFADGLTGKVRFLPSFFRGVFAHLTDATSFGQVMLVDGVVTWPGDLELAPDAMHRAIKSQGEWLLD